jgi:hypothetical protein
MRKVVGHHSERRREAPHRLRQRFIGLLGLRRHLPAPVRLFDAAALTTRAYPKSARLQTLVVLLFTAALLSACGSAHKQVRRAVFVQGKVKPTLVVYGAGTPIKQVRWLSYGGAKAEAHGLFAVDDCIPTCAEGHTTWEPIRFVASYVGPCKGKRSYRLLSVPIRGIKDFPLENG